MKQFIDSEFMLRSARMIRLTQCGVAGVDNGNSTTCFVKPEHINYVCRASVRMAANEKELETVMPISATYIGLVPSGHLYVMESPEMIATLRESALGNATDILTEATPIR